MAGIKYVKVTVMLINDVDHRRGPSVAMKGPSYPKQSEAMARDIVPLPVFQCLSLGEPRGNYTRQDETGKTLKL